MGKKSIRYLLLISFLWYLAEGLFAPLYSIYANIVGGDIFQIASLYAIYLILYGILYILFGKLIDRTKKDSVFLLIGYILNTICSFGLIFVDSMWDLFIIEIILAIALSLSTPSYNSLFTKNLQKGKYAEQWGWNDGGAYIISGISLFFGGFIVGEYGWKWLFLIMGCIELITSIIIIIEFLREQQEQQSPTPLPKRVLSARVVKIKL